MEKARLTSISKYEILSEIGRGRTGFVYHAQDPLTERQVAIKIVAEEWGGDAVVLQHLYERFQPIGKLSHPNIIPIYEIGDLDGQFYIVMQFSEGDSLDALLRGERRLSLIEKIDIVRQFSAGLGFAHQNGIVHGNVKPSSILVRKDNNAQLLDFDIPRLIDRGPPVGFMAYPAPEWLMGHPHDARSDIFAAGVIFFQVLTGSLPFGGPFDYLIRLVKDKRLPLGNFLEKYPAVLDDILDRSLAKDPADRYQSADEMAIDLCDVLGSLKRKAATVQ